MTDMGVPLTLYEYTVEPLIRTYMGEITHYRDKVDDYEWRKRMLWEDIFRDAFFECWYFCSESTFEEPTFVWSNDNYWDYIRVIGEIAIRGDVFHKGAMYEFAEILDYTGELLESENDRLLECLSDHPFKGSVVDFRNYLFSIRISIVETLAEILGTYESKIALGLLVDLVTIDRLSPMNVTFSKGEPDLCSWDYDLGYTALQNIRDCHDPQDKINHQKIEQLINSMLENPEVQISEEQISFARE